MGGARWIGRSGEQAACDRAYDDALNHPQRGEIDVTAADGLFDVGTFVGPGGLECATLCAPRWTLHPRAPDPA